MACLLLGAWGGFLASGVRCPEGGGQALIQHACAQGKTWRKSYVPKANGTWMIENGVAGYTDPETREPMQLQVRQP